MTTTFSSAQVILFWSLLFVFFQLGLYSESYFPVFATGAYWQVFTIGLYFFIMSYSAYLFITLTAPGIGVMYWVCWYFQSIFCIHTAALLFEGLFYYVEGQTEFLWTTYWEYSFPFGVISTSLYLMLIGTDIIRQSDEKKAEQQVQYISHDDFVKMQVSNNSQYKYI